MLFDYTQVPVKCFSLIIDAYIEYTKPIVSTQRSPQDNDYPFVLQQEEITKYDSRQTFQHPNIM